MSSWSKLESKDPVAGLKHHGSEGRIGPAARSPDCQTSLSEPTRNYSSKPWLVHCQLPPCSCPPGAGFRSAQLRSKLESKHPVAGLACVVWLPTATLLVSSWSWLLFCTASVQAGVQGPCRRPQTPWDRARGPPPPLPNIAFSTYKKTGSLSCLSAACLTLLSESTRKLALWPVFQPLVASWRLVSCFLPLVACNCFLLLASSFLFSCFLPLLLVMTSWPLLLVIPPLTRSPYCRQGSAD